MNQARRKTLQEASKLLDKVMKLVEDARDEEQCSFDNLPENLQDSSRGEAMEDAVDHLDDALSSLCEAKECIDNAMES